MILSAAQCNHWSRRRIDRGTGRPDWGAEMGLGRRVAGHGAQRHKDCLRTGAQSRRQAVVQRTGDGMRFEHGLRPVASGSLRPPRFSLLTASRQRGRARAIAEPRAHRVMLRVGSGRCSAGGRASMRKEGNTVASPFRAPSGPTLANRPATRTQQIRNTEPSAYSYYGRPVGLASRGCRGYHIMAVSQPAAWRGLTSRTARWNADAS